jgi:pyrroline-5-carboxylate reductase
MRIGILGTGNMGKALINGLLNSFGDEVEIVAYDVSPKARESLLAPVMVRQPQKWFGSKGEKPQAIVVAVKPADVAAGLSPLKEYAAKNPDVLWCSIAAGISISSLEKWLGSSAKICRAMPNTPALIGEGMTAFALNGRCSAADAEKARTIFNACGKAVQVDEKLINAITGLSGSGPAYVYLFIEALIEGGVSAGLPYQTARACALQTVIGAAKMVEKTGEDPAALKAKVMSPAGTTARGIMALEQNNFKYAVMKAVGEATARAKELDQ